MAKVDKVGTILREGTRQQQKRAMALLVDHPYVSLERRIERVEPKEWARPLFRDVAALVGDHGCPQGTSNARYVATLAGLKTQDELCPVQSGREDGRG